MYTLERVLELTKRRVEASKATGLPDKLPDDGRDPFLFETVLRRPGMSFICEVKKASPSAGVICERYGYMTVARQYEDAGASAISVLTEPDFFMGSSRHLSEIREIVDVPLLRKDFIIDPFQIKQSAFLGADAILLICAVLAPDQIREYIKLADSIGLSCLVEVHDEKELEAALSAGSRVIGANNRDLKTLEVDLSVSLRLKKLAPPDVIFVAESGISTPQEVRLLTQAGVDGVLIGGALMRAPNKAAMLDELRSDKK